MPLEIGPAVVGVEAAPAPVVVGVVGVRAELEQDRRILAGLGRADDEEEVDLGGPPVPADELAAVVGHAQPDVVVARAPVGRHLELEARPASRSRATRRSRGSDRTAPGGRSGSGPSRSSPPAGRSPGNTAARSSRCESGPTRRPVAEPVGVALDHKRRRVVGPGPWFPGCLQRA